MATQDSKTTKDHKTIQKWAEERDGKPAIVKGTGDSGKAGGLLRIDFPGGAEESLEELSWDKFFTIFDENNLQFLYQEETKDGSKSRFNKFVNKD
ncbi:hypothetical protein RM545_00010 [Zunongwangia sp. F260]|uniref:1,4-alpha-glucan branching enzyme n=1 Tax=Autumnicola lenta TaxID=3075593 RepID=A0ABU3CFF7_9FLAO|nr:hypothetical protein [Zunongwangia sp. F260]MDT0645059.1 hypothetical protein [Zunongwangia sp. F260]